MKIPRAFNLLAFFTIFICIFGIFVGLFWAGSWILRPPAAATLIFATRTSQALKSPTPRLPTATATASTPVAKSASPGKIVYVCQVFKTSANDQICLMDADGSNQRRLTTQDGSKHYYPSLAPDGLSIVFSSNLSGQGQYDLYEMDLAGKITRLTANFGILTAPEISPDGSQIVFTWGNGLDKTAIGLMNRDGSHPRELYPNGWDPTWSPDGAKILFATSVTGYGIQLASINLDGTDFQRLSNLPNLRGRSDWANNDRWLITYSGIPWRRELFLMNIDGSAPFQLSPAGGNSQGPSFSPNGDWVTFTAYFDHYGDENGCEIYTLKTDGTGLTRLTDNDFCDWQPRWGP
jgi:Tol biopolymer transport system component